MEIQKKKTLSPQGIAEIVFDIGYLLFAVIAGITMLQKSNWIFVTNWDGTNNPLGLYGLLSLVLGCGDAFHLIPRIFGHINGMERYTKILGFGKLVTSVTMTFFYLLLYTVWSISFGFPLNSPVGYVLVGLAILRIVLCLFPQNKWFSTEGSMKWSILRNLPFLLIGIVIIVLFHITARNEIHLFSFMPIAIILSFLFYIPVVLWSDRYPKVGALMLPKTAAYIWMICMGFSLI